MGPVMSIQSLFCIKGVDMAGLWALAPKGLPVLHPSEPLSWKPHADSLLCWKGSNPIRTPQQIDGVVAIGVQKA